MKNIVKRSRVRVRYCYSLSLIDTKDKMKEALIIKCPQKPEQRWIGSYRDVIYINNNDTYWYIQFNGICKKIQLL